MTDKEEFEEIWKDESMGYVPPILIKSLKELCLKYWLESRKRFIAQLKKDSKLAGFDIKEWEEEKEVEK